MPLLADPPEGIRCVGAVKDRIQENAEPQTPNSKPRTPNLGQHLQARADHRCHARMVIALVGQFPTRISAKRQFLHIVVPAIV